MAIELRHVSFADEKRAAAQQAGENARDANRALAARVVGTLVTLERYAATGSTTTKIPLQAPTRVRPRAVMLARAFQTYDPGSDFAITPRLNFYHDSVGLGVYEPAGLVANTFYDFVFLVLE